MILLSIDHKNADTRTIKRKTTQYSVNRKIAEKQEIHRKKLISRKKDKLSHRRSQICCVSRHINYIFFAVYLCSLTKHFVLRIHFLFSGIQQNVFSKFVR